MHSRIGKQRALANDPSTNKMITVEKGSCHDHFNKDIYGRIFILAKSVEKEVSRFQRRLLLGFKLLEDVELVEFRSCPP